MDYFVLYSLMAAALGLFMAWGIGANDVANAMATSIGSRVLTLRQAVVVAAIFEFAGAVLAGGEVTSTVRKGMIDTELLGGDPQMLIAGMLAALAAAGTWLMVATRAGWPVSTTHSIVGAIIGFAVVAIGVEAVHWEKVTSIVASWIVSPICAGVLAFILFSTVRRLILETREPLANARRYVPIYMFLGGALITLVTLLKGLKHLGLHLSMAQSYLLAACVGVIIMIVGIYFIRRIETPAAEDREAQFNAVERVFAVLMVLTACAMAFAHGSNDVANAVGPVAAVLSTLDTGSVLQESPIPIWVLLMGGIGIVAGLATLGRYVIATVGDNITHLTPSRGFAAEMAAAGTVVMASGTGLPISTTQTLVGAVLGVGFARGIAAINLGVVRSIFFSWVITLPAGAGLAAVFYLLFRQLPG